MFVHGIPFRYLPRHYPILHASCPFPNQSPDQQSDRQRFIEQFGFKPVHFLRASDRYPLDVCMKACLRFGDTLLVFHSLPFPRLQLSPNEWGVQKVDMRSAWFVTSKHPQAKVWFRKHLPRVPFYRMGQEMNVCHSLA